MFKFIKSMFKKAEYFDVNGTKILEGCILKSDSHNHVSLYTFSKHHVTELKTFKVIDDELVLLVLPGGKAQVSNKMFDFSDVEIVKDSDLPKYNAKHKTFDMITTTDYTNSHRKLVYRCLK